MLCSQSYDQQVCLNNRLDAPAIGRIQLDEALQLRGNFLLGGVGNACIGCVVWQKSFHILQKLASTLACLGFISACAPWGFQNLLKSLDILSVHYATVSCTPESACSFFEFSFSSYSAEKQYTFRGKSH